MNGNVTASSDVTTTTTVQSSSQNGNHKSKKSFGTMERNSASQSQMLVRLDDIY